MSSPESPSRSHLALRVKLKELQGRHLSRKTIVDILKLALGRPLLETSDARLRRIPESDIVFFKFVFLRLFRVGDALRWTGPKRVSEDGWCKVFHVEIAKLAGLSKDEVRRRVPRFHELGLINTSHIRREDGPEVDGVLIQPRPDRVFDLLKMLGPAKKEERERVGRRRGTNPLSGITVKADGPMTPAWLREREIAWALEHMSNYREVLPGAIRFARTGATSRTRVRHKRNADVPNGHIKFALGMFALFGVDELHWLADSPDVFDEDGGRILSDYRIRKATGCTPREARDAASFYSQAGVFRSYYKPGARYLVNHARKPPRIRWASWSFAEFVDFLKFPRSRFEWGNERLRYTIICPAENQPGDEPWDVEGEVQLPLRLNDVTAQVFQERDAGCPEAPAPGAVALCSCDPKIEKGAAPLSHDFGGSRDLAEATRLPLPWAPEVAVPAEYLAWAVQSRSRVQGHSMAPATIPGQHSQSKERQSITNPGELVTAYLPGLEPPNPASSFVEDIYFPFASFLERNPKLRAMLPVVPLTARDGATLIFRAPVPGVVTLLPEQVLLCASVLRYATAEWEDNEIDHTRSRMIFRLVKTKAMTPEMVVWYVKKCGDSEFDLADEWLKRAPLDLVLKRWRRVSRAYERWQRSEEAERLSSQAMPLSSAELAAEFNSLVQNFARDRKGGLLVKLGWLHQTGHNVAKVLSQPHLDRLADLLRGNPCIYAALREALPLDTWCGFVAQEQRALLRRAREDIEAALGRRVWLEALLADEETRFQEHEEMLARRQAKADGGWPEDNEPSLFTQEADRVSLSRVAIPTCLGSLNRALGGGIQVPSVSLLCAVTGAGKTLLSLQLAYGFAQLGKRVQFLTADDNDRLAERLVSSIVEVPFSEICAAGFSFEQLSNRDPAKGEKLNELRAVLASNLTIREWPAFRDPRQLTPLLETARVDAVILDGLTTQMDSLFTMETGISRNKAYKRVLNELLGFSVANHCAVIVTVQASKSARLTKKLAPDQIQDFTGLEATFGNRIGFLGLSSIRRFNSQGEQITTRQSLNVLPPGRSGAVVELTPEFQFQRFSDGKTGALL